MVLFSTAVEGRRLILSSPLAKELRTAPARTLGVKRTFRAQRRDCTQSGLLTTQVREMPLGKVEALLMRQGLIGKLLGYGTLVFKGSGGTRRACKNIAAPFEFYRRV